MARLVTASPMALATEWEAQRIVWKDTSLSPDPTGHTDEEQDLVAAILNAVSDAVHRLLGGSIMEEERTERYDGGKHWLRLRAFPVWSVTSVVEDTVTLVADRDYVVYPEIGYIRKLAAPFLDRPLAVTVTYTAGWAKQVRDADDNLVRVDYRPGGEAIRQAVLLWCKAIWDVGPAVYSYQVTDLGVLLARNADVPPVVAALLAPYQRPQAVLA